MEFIAGNIENERDEILLNIWGDISSKLSEYDLIIGYKTPSLGRELDETPSIIIRSKEYGIILLDFVNYYIKEFDEDNEYWRFSDDEFIFSKDLSIDLFEKELINKLKDDRLLYNLRKGEFNFDLQIKKLLIFSQNSMLEINKLNDEADIKLSNDYIGNDNWEKYFDNVFTRKTLIESQYIDKIDSILDGSNIYEKKHRKKIETELKTMNDYIKKSLSNTFKLDSTQRQIALQIPNGPQRIRGLAGTGKTIILCMKAALAHKFHPQLQILFVFNTQSMYAQVEELITRYYFNETGKMPDFNKLNILHAWGGSNKPGLYYNTAKGIGIQPLNFMNVRKSPDPLDAIFNDLIKNHKDKIQQSYDMVLIDEAQDFPASFFETIFYLTKESSGSSLKRIIWAYDEFQSLTDIKIKEPKDLFGVNEKGLPNIPNDTLEGMYKGNIKKDFVLPNSYRNPRITLMVAHGLALGLYTNTKVPMMYKNDWEARGYNLISPDKQVFNEGDNVILERPEANSKNNLEILLQERNNENKLIQFIPTHDLMIQLDNVACKIENIVKEHNVEPEEILVIDIDTKNSKSNFEIIRHKLDYKNIKCITPGFIESNDSFKVPGFVTLTTPFRAKGNETNIVLIINGNKVLDDNTFRLRNSMFVSITRSRGWCYIYSSGENNSKLKTEINKILNDYPKFEFVFPSIDSIKRRYSILTSSKNLEKFDSQIDEILKNEDLNALLIEKLLKDPEFLNKLRENRDKE
ncbi:DEAD/DEAH box helicase [Litoribacter ruber]|uniref:DEAD/DEAH box helicase n=1 Tax=Litoribacter ruber TaxID=702568 RepID=UPI001BDAC349|nr:DEAD/DEAH box helicase family protein [Litoribacter ruber]MBT0812976.1 DEAD/DEAH box helicase [Litoribacter ruber]